jgi:hypothetical protein
MKKNTIALLLTAITVLSISTGCKKHPDSPDFSLRTRKARVANTWKVDNYKVDGIDFTSLFAGYTETFTNSGAYSYTWGVLNGAGTWTFQNDFAEIRLNGNDEQSNRVLTILKLEEKSMWYTYMVGGIKNEIHLTGN